MTDTKLDPALLQSIRGPVFWPSDPEYDRERKVFNGMFDRHPLVIIRCLDSQDVVQALAYARDTQSDLTIYGGGHGVTGPAVADGAVCVDLRGMRDIEIDPASRVAKVAGGCTWGELDAAAQQYGLAVTGGRVSATGVTGLALGSGSGWLERSLGFTCDSLLAAELVAASGDIVTASAEVNPELFWGLRGGGGNFGIVTQLTLRLHPVGPIILGGMLIYPADQALAVARSWVEFMSTAPDEVGGGIAFITAPPAPFIPAHLKGQPVAGVIVCYHGDIEEGQAVLAPLLEFGSPAVNMVQPMPYLALQQMIDGGNPNGMRNYWSADFYGSLPDEAIRTLCEAATHPVSPLTQIVFVKGGGAIATVPEDATAFGNRAAQYNIHYLSMWADPSQDALNIAYTRTILTSMKPWSTGGVYLNFIGDEGQARVKSAFSPDKWDRLRALKRTWDPDNVFSHNQNIPPG
jgi:FAD/FMN-containing dehydrogenase